MSFSSKDWTVPEVCVWITSGNRTRVNAMAPDARKSLTFAEAVCPGAYAARDDVIAKAQVGALVVTCLNPRRGVGEPDRVSLSSTYWESAELLDVTHWQAAGSWWCVARRVDESRCDDSRELLVSSAKAKELWPEKSGAADNGSSGQSVDATASNAAADESALASAQLKTQRPAKLTKLKRSFLDWLDRTSQRNTAKTYKGLAEDFRKAGGGGISAKSVSRVMKVLREERTKAD